MVNGNMTPVDGMRNTRNSGWITSILTVISGIIVAILLGVTLGSLTAYGIAYWLQGACFIIPGIFGLIASGVKQSTMYLVALIIGILGLISFLLSFIRYWAVAAFLVYFSLGYGIGLILVWLIGFIVMLVMTVNMGTLRSSPQPGIVYQPGGMAQPMTVVHGNPNQTVITTQGYPGGVVMSQGYSAPGYYPQMQPQGYPAHMTPQGGYSYPPPQADVQPATKQL